MFPGTLKGALLDIGDRSAQRRIELCDGTVDPAVKFVSLDVDICRKAINGRRQMLSGKTFKAPTQDLAQVLLRAFLCKETQLSVCNVFNNGRRDGEDRN